MNRQKLIIKILISLLLTAVMLTEPACWDQREVERLGIIMAVGVEPAPGGRFQVIVQEIVPSAQVRGAGGGGGGPMGGSQKPYRNRSTEGNTIFEAVRKLSRQSPRQLFFAHNQVIILSEDLVRQRGVKEIMDFFERNPQIRRTTWLLVARTSIVNLLDVSGRIEATPAQRIFGTINEQELSSQYAVQRLGDFLELMESESTHPFTAVVETVPNPAAPKQPQQGAATGQVPEPDRNVLLNGTAVFRRDKMAGWLNSRESRGLLWVRGEVNGGIIEVPNPDEKEKHVSLEILRSKTKLRPEIRDGQIYITVEIKEESNVGETTGPLELTEPEVIQKLESLQSAAIQAEIEAALAKAQQEYGVDVFGFGEAVHRKYPQEWKEMKQMWPELFPGVQVQFEIETKIRRTGLISRPVEPRQQ